MVHLQVKLTEALVTGIEMECIGGAYTVDGWSYQESPVVEDQTNIDGPSTMEYTGSIVKQVLMKIAAQIVQSDKYATVEEALVAIDTVYNQLKEKYLEELKNN